MHSAVFETIWNCREKMKSMYLKLAFRRYLQQMLFQIVFNTVKIHALETIFSFFLQFQIVLKRFLFYQIVLDIVRKRVHVNILILLEYS